MKRLILGIVIGILLCGGVVYATNYMASDVSYTPSNSDWEVNNVNDALNDLYDISSSLNNGGFASGVTTVDGNGGTVTIELDFTPTFVAVKSDNDIDQYRRWNMWYGILDSTNEYVSSLGSLTYIVNDDLYRGTTSDYVTIEENKLIIKNWDYSGEKTVYWYAGAN